MSRDTQTDFLLQDLIFLINLKKSLLKSSQQMEFSVLKMDTYGINKIDRSDALNSTVLPACLQLSYLQKQRIKSLIRLVYARKIQQTDALISGLAAFWNVCPLVKNMQKRREFAHKCSGIYSSKVCNPNIQKRTVKYTDSIVDRQKDCNFISFENRGYTQQRTLAHQKIHFGLPSQQTNCTVCKGPTQCSDCTSRLIVTKNQG